MPVIQGYDLDADLAAGLSEQSHHSDMHEAAMAQLSRDRARLGMPPFKVARLSPRPAEARSWALPAIYLLGVSASAVIGIAVWVAL